LEIVRQSLPRLRGLDVELAGQYQAALDDIDADVSRETSLEEWVSRADLEAFAIAVVRAAQDPDRDNYGMEHVKAHDLLVLAKQHGIETRP